MYYFFSSEYLAGIKLNGAYLGLINDEVKGISITNDLSFVEICPLNSIERALNFILDNSFLTAPPPNALVTDLKGGYLIKFIKTYSGGEFKVIKQEKFNDLIITAYSENGVKISIETKNDFLIENVSTDSNSVNFYRPEFNKNLIAVAFNGKKTLLSVFNTLDKIQNVFFGEVDGFSFENGFSTTENFLDMAKHSLTVSWEFDGCAFAEKERCLTCSKDFDPKRLTPPLIPYAFLEEFLVQGDFKQYLADTLLENADKLVGFFNEYLGIMPPPSFRKFNEIGLVYKQTENKYFVDYFSFDVENGKICGIKKND